MSRNRFILNENDRQSILSMYGLLVEEVRPIKLVGSINLSDDIKNDNFFKSNDLTFTIKIYQGDIIKDGEPLQSFTINKSFSFENEVNLDNGTYTFVITTNSTDYDTTDIKYTIEETTKNIKLNFLFYKIKQKDIEEIKLSRLPFTSMKIKVFDYDNNLITNYKLKLEGDGKTVFNKKITETNELILGFLKDGQLINDIKGKKVEYDNTKKNIFNEKGVTPFAFTVKTESGLSKIINFDVTKFNNGDNFTLTEIKNKKYLTIPNDFKPKDSDKNVINIKLEPTIVELLVIDNKTKKPLPNAEVTFPNLGKNGKTNEEGKILIDNVGLDRINYTISLNDYKTMFNELDVKPGKNEVTVKLRSKSDESYDVDVTDEFKDGLFFIYGRSTANSYDNSLNNAKINAINKYIEKNKRKYKNVPEFTDQKIENWDLNYDVSKEVKDPKTKQTSVVIKFKKTDIKDYLEKFTKENKIKIDREKLELPSDILLTDAVSKAYRNNKKVFVVVGLNPKREPMDNTQTRTQEMVSKINRDKNLSTSIMNKTIPLFVNVDTNNSNYNELSTKTQIKSYPRVIILKPTNDKNFTVDLNTEYFNFEKDPSQLEKYL